MNLILQKTFQRELAYILGGLGEKLNYFRDLGSKGKILSGGYLFQRFGGINALFIGSKGAKTPPPLGASTV